MVVDISGIQATTIRFCGCGEFTRGNHLEYKQLLRGRMFPATITHPKTVVTFSCLTTFHLLTLQGKLTGNDYYMALARLSDGSGIDPPPVSPFQFPTDYTRGNSCHRNVTKNSCDVSGCGGLRRCSNALELGYYLVDLLLQKRDHALLCALHVLIRVSIYGKTADSHRWAHSSGANFVYCPDLVTNP